MSEIIEKVRMISGKNIYLCYQCGMCSASCPMAQYMDVLPHQIIRLLQLGNPDVVNVKSIWICVSCMTCVDRCPRRVDPGVIFEALRLITLRKGIDKIRYRDLRDISEAPSMALVAISRKMTG